MHEIIAERNRKSYIFLLVLVVLSILTNLRYISHPMMGYIVIPMLVAFSLFGVFLLYMLLSPHGAIERRGDSLIIRRGIFRTVLSINDILSVCAAPHPNKPDTVQKNAVTIKALVDGKEITVLCGDLNDGEAAIRKLNDLLRNP